MSILPIENNTNTGLFDKLVGGALGAIYGGKADGVLGGLVGGYTGMKNPNSLYERLMGQYLPNQVVLKTENQEGLL